MRKKSEFTIVERAMQTVDGFEKVFKTIGQGLIKVDKTFLPIPTVIFAFNGKKIRIELKKEIAERIEADISKGVQRYGMSEKYWAYVEELAYLYWQELDRHVIFNLSVPVDNHL